MAAVAEQLLDTRAAFDGVAATYAQSNLANRIICEMRARTRAVLASHASPRDRLLDLGCGPGCDVEPLAREGYEVTAVDWSPEMVRQTEQRVERAGLQHRVRVRCLGIHEIDRLAPAIFDAALSNFGPLNCVPDLTHAARLIAARLRPGGVLVASVIGRVCPWEIALYLARGNPGRAAARFQSGEVAVPLEGRRVWMRYYTPRMFERAFARAGFERLSLRTLGLFVPPPYLEPFASRNVTLVNWLQRIDDAVGAWPGFRTCGDHFVIALQRT